MYSDFIVPGVLHYHLWKVAACYTLKHSCCLYPLIREIPFNYRCIYAGFKNVSQLVAHYQWKQADGRKQPKVATKQKSTTKGVPQKSISLYVRGPDVDVYALGCLYIELFGWRGVWPGLNRVQIMQKMWGSLNIPPLMPATSHLHSRFRKVSSFCCQLDKHPQDNSCSWTTWKWCVGFI